MSMSKTLSYGVDILFIIFAAYLFFCYFDIFLKRRKRTVLSVVGLVAFMAWQFEMSSVNLLPAYVMAILLLRVSLHCLRLLKLMRENFGTNVFLQLLLMQSGC